ncbi:MAG: hypothetical protein GWN71_44125, partial [Gammaproteobacteria bacterium]|nr:hypothetical protein [Gammaproteobacteria bacterium]
RGGDLDRAVEAWSTFLALQPEDGGDRRAYVERAVAAITELKRALESAPE